MNQEPKDSNFPNEPLTDHEYDGIQEYDNPLPLWWLLTFFGTIIFAFIYWLHYTTQSGPTSQQELAQALQVIEAHKGAMPAKQWSESDLTEALQKVDLQAAAAQFTGKCAACHGQELQGQIGPNLTDAYWLHGKGTPTDIMNVIKKGVPEKGMPPWEGLLSDDEVVSLVAFISAKQDSNPAQAKAPQGEKVR